MSSCTCARYQLTFRKNMKRYLPTLIIAITCSILSACIAAFFVGRQYQKVLDMIYGGRPAEYLITATKIREGQTDELIKSLEWNAQVEFLQQQHLRNTQWSLDFSHQILDIYKKKYDIEVAEPLQSLPVPKERFSEDQLMQLVSIPAPDQWPEWPLK